MTDGMRKRRRKRIAAAALLLVAGGYAWAAMPGKPTTARFAVWPEDNPRDARRECAQHLVDQPWRWSADGVGQRFREEVLGLPHPETEEELMDQYFIANYSTRRFGPCWYVLHSSPREGYAHINAGWRWEGDSLLVVVDWASHGAADVEVGFGGETQRLSTEATPAEFGFDDVEGPGHYIVRFEGGEAYAAPLPVPPPAPTQELVRAPESIARPVRGDGPRACEQRFTLGHRWADTPRKSVDRMLGELGLKHARLPRPPRVVSRGSDWVVEVDRTPLRVDLDRVGSCYRALGVEPANGDDLGLRLTKERGLATLAFDWGEADEAFVQASDSFYYLRRTDLPLTFYASEEDLPMPDYVLLALYENDRFYSAIAYEVAPR